MAISCIENPQQNLTTRDLACGTQSAKWMKIPAETNQPRTIPGVYQKLLLSLREPIFKFLAWKDNAALDD
jgi:hypothetical protein